MGKYDLAIKFGKSLLSDTANYVKACGKRSILETKPPIFHGINPTLTYAPSGKSFALPRFCTEEMKQARQMNKIAIRQAKAGEVVRTYTKATPQDLKRLTSETIEDSYSRVEWTNPNDGKVYNLLKQGETKNGKVIIRILDEEGAFVKEAELTPSKIVMVDAHTDVSSFEHNELTHANAVYKYIRRNNPFAKIEYYDVTRQIPTPFLGYKYDIDTPKLSQTYRFLKDKINNGEKIDYITTSIGNEVSGNIENCAVHYTDVDALKSLSSSSKGKTRIMFSAGNDGSTKSNVFLSAETAEGVGALTPEGKITSFSASRNSKHTQHYEIGEYYVKPTEYGYNITGRPGTDILYPDNMTRSQIQEIKESYERVEAECNNIRKRVSKLRCYEIMRQDDHKKRWYLLDDIFHASVKRRQTNENNYKKVISVIDRIEMLLNSKVSGTSFSTPIRTAKLALNDMMEGIL